jgi:Na+/H+ antiporter NhaD/arsenite permease-like protein
MAPLASVLMVLLLGVTGLLFQSKVFTLPANQKPAYRIDTVLLTVTIIAFIIFIGLSDLRYGWFAVLAVVAIYGSWRRDIVYKIDWLLLLIFVLMFIVLRSVSALPAIHTYLASFDLKTPFRVYAAGALLSQGISNVPAAILLTEFTHDWHALAYGVSVGGFGLAIGSMANLIAVRLAALRGMWGLFHLISLLFFLLAGMMGAGLLWVAHG